MLQCPLRSRWESCPIHILFKWYPIVKCEMTKYLPCEKNSTYVLCSVLFPSAPFCYVLFYSVLFCSVLLCTVLFCYALFISLLLCSVMYCFILFWSGLVFSVHFLSVKCVWLYANISQTVKLLTEHWLTIPQICPN